MIHKSIIYHINIWVAAFVIHKIIMYYINIWVSACDIHKIFFLVFWPKYEIAFNTFPNKFSCTYLDSTYMTYVVNCWDRIQLEAFSRAEACRPVYRNTSVSYTHQTNYTIHETLFILILKTETSMFFIANPISCYILFQRSRYQEKDNAKKFSTTSLAKMAACQS